MARITVEDCLEHVENRFKLVLLASSRARQLVRGAEPLVPWENDKPTVVALREIAENLVNDETMRESSAAMAEGDAEFVEDELAALYSEISREMNQTGFGQDQKPEAAEAPDSFLRQGLDRPDDAQPVAGAEAGHEQVSGSDSDAGMKKSDWQLLESPGLASDTGSGLSPGDPDSSSEEEQGP